MIEEARHRIEVLVADTITEGMRDARRITATERTAMIQLLTEVHRLNIAVSEQRKTLERRLTAKKRPHSTSHDSGQIVSGTQAQRSGQVRRTGKSPARK